MVFLTSKPSMRERILPLHSAWLDLLILRMMEPCANPTKPVWFVLDELASLNKLPQLHTAMTENRKYGNPVVLGFQGRSQLEKRYGQDAEAMLSQPATKIFFKTSEPRAAKWILETLGEVEVERLKESRTPGLLRSKKNFAMEIATKPLVMASEIAGLEPLRGYIKQENRILPVKFALTRLKRLQPEFIERKMTYQSRGRFHRRSQCRRLPKLCPHCRSQLGQRSRYSCRLSFQNLRQRMLRLLQKSRSSLKSRSRPSVESRERRMRNPAIGMRASGLNEGYELAVERSDRGGNSGGDCHGC
jgi:type IV secretory pathway TraG/TraD family ATPase VirD4